MRRCDANTTVKSLEGRRKGALRVERLTSRHGEGKVSGRSMNVCQDYASGVSILRLSW